MIYFVSPAITGRLLMAGLSVATLFLGVVAAQPAMPGAQATRPNSLTGVLLLAHGGTPAWDANVQAIAVEVDRALPTETALGMATRANIQAAVQRLESRGVQLIVAVPLFVSSHSSVITATEYLLGLRRDMPEALKVFATMSHAPQAETHAGHVMPAEDGTRRIQARVPIRMTAALDAHPLLVSIVTSRVKEVSTSVNDEAAILVAHGPTADDVNERWLENLRRVAQGVGAQLPLASIDALTVRDDAPASIRDAATRELRMLVEKRRSEGRKVLIVPVLLSYGGIEAGIRQRLEGLDYTMSAKALAPDPRLVEWVRAMAAEAVR